MQEAIINKIKIILFPSHQTNKKLKNERKSNSYIFFNGQLSQAGFFFLQKFLPNETKRA